MNPRPTALLLDYGGVLTERIADVHRRFCAVWGVDPASLAETLDDWVRCPDNRSPVPALERGELPAEEFEAMLAQRLRRCDGAPVRAQGLLRAMFDDTPLDDDLLRLVIRIRDSGVRTVLVSNAWGTAYPRERLARGIGDWVLSNEVGSRKPEPEIYRYAARCAGSDVGACVFVDDRASNVASAVSVGMIGLHFTDRVAGRSRLRELFLAGPGGVDASPREEDC